ncbi:MAG: two-component regulator propeller domain-containing protein [Bacteroidota bacterium]
MKRILSNKFYLRIFLSVLLILSGYCTIIFGQTMGLRFNHLSISDGLPDDGFTSIMQDHLGFLWIGTTNGLSKYDGYNFTNYYRNENDSTSLIGRNVRCLMEDINGDIWIGTYYGLSILLRDEDKFISYENDKKDPNTLSDNWVKRIYEDKRGNIWIGTKSGGLNLIKRELLLDKKKRVKFKNINLDNFVEGTDNIFDIVEDSENTIWACTRNGLLKISEEEPELIQPTKSNFYNKNNHFLSIVIDEQGLIWLGTKENGITLYNKNTNEFTSFYHESLRSNKDSFCKITSLLLDSNGNLWAGSLSGINGGLLLFDRTTKKYDKFIHDPLNPNSISKDYGPIRSIIEDNFGNIWVTIYNGKINKVNPQNNLFKYYRNYSRDENSIIFSKNTRMLEAKDGRLWFATENGLFEYLPWEKRFVKIVADNQYSNCNFNSELWRIAEDINGNLWTFGKSTELKVYNPNTGSLKCFNHDINLPDQEIYSVHTDEYGIIWFGTYNNGIFNYNPFTDSVVNYKFKANDFTTISNDGIAKICEDSSNTLWIATRDCWLNKFNKKTSKVKRMDISRQHGYFCDLFVDEKNQLWAGTSLGGIYLFDTKNDNYQRINTDHGLPSNNNVMGFSEDHDGNIYCCSESYLIKLDHEGKLKEYYNISADEEVLHQTYYIKKTKEVFVISDKGFYSFSPDSLKPNLIPPKMVVTNLKYKDKPFKVGKNSPLKNHINVAEKIELEYWQNDLTIQYAGIHYINQDENKYKYILENYDDNWRDAGKNREITYTNLEHGLYTFKVLSSNSNGIWATEPAILSIMINPPWWFTWWAYSIYLLIFISTFWFIYILQRRRIKINNEIKMKEFEAQKLREVDQLKSKFFANISHEFRTPLTLIKSPIERMLDNDNVDDPKKIYRMIKRNSEKLLNLINELLDLSKLESGKMKLSAQKTDIVSFIKSLSMSFESLAEIKGIRINITSSSDIIELYYDKEKMQKIITNLLSNAFKFTNEGGKVSVNIKEVIAEQKLFIKISDSGMGIPEKDLPKIFDRFYQVEGSNTTGTGIGLSLTKELVEMHHGIIEADSTIGKGTAFTIAIPLGKEHLHDEEVIYDKSELVLKEENEDENLNSLSVDKEPIVLVVEDNKDLRDFIVSILKSKYRLYEARDGEEGYEKAFKHLPDLIVSDIMMPKMTGDKMCERLKNNQITSHIPIILLTAKSSDEDKISGLEMGADDYLIKPFNNRELVARINNLLVQRKNLREKYLRETEIHPTEVAVSSIDKMFIEKVIEIIEMNISDTKFSVELMVTEIGMSRAQLYRKFTHILGETPGDFIRKYRVKRAADLIRQRFGNITDVAYEVGFDSLSYFAKCFKMIYNQSPHQFKKKYVDNK